MRRNIGRVWIALIALAAVAAIIWFVMPRPVQVEAAVVTRGRFVATIDEDGKTRIRNRYVVSAPLGGHLNRVRFKAGDAVNAGEVVASIAPAPAPFLDPRSRKEAEEKLGAAEASRERAKEVLERARAQAEQAKIDLERTRTLVKSGAATVQALERGELAARVADRDVRAGEFMSHAAEHEYDQATALLARYSDPAKSSVETWDVTSPVTGVVLKVIQESEITVQPGATLVEIGDPTDLEIVVDVLSTDAVAIRLGADVTIEHWGGPGTLNGQVRRVEPAAFTKVSTLGVEEQRVNVIVDIVSPYDQWRGLGDAYQLDTRIAVYSQDDATIAPTGALFRRGEVWKVFVIVESKVEERPVTLLYRSGRSAAIASGLKPGDQVIVYPSDRIAPGTRVAIR